MAKAKIVRVNEKIAETVVDDYKKLKKVLLTAIRRLNRVSSAVIPRLRISLWTHISQEMVNQLKKPKKDL